MSTMTSNGEKRGSREKKFVVSVKEVQEDEEHEEDDRENVDERDNRSDYYCPRHRCQHHRRGFKDYRSDREDQQDKEEKQYKEERDDDEEGSRYKPRTSRCRHGHNHNHRHQRRHHRRGCPHAHHAYDNEENSPAESGDTLDTFEIKNVKGLFVRVANNR